MTLSWYMAEARAAFLDKWPVMRAGLILAATWTAILFGNQNIGPFVEGRLWPVIAGTTITRATEQADGTTVFYGTATKLRSCSFDHVTWYRGNPDNEEGVVPVTFLNGPRTHTPGTYKFGPWSSPLPKDELLTRSYAIIWHRCHPLGLTASWFYP